MTPYYQDELITIYHGDCLEILPGLVGIQSIVTDPPYGISLETDYKSNGRDGLAQNKDYPPIYGDNESFNPSHLLGFGNIILWGGNHYADKLPAFGGWLVWDKRDGINPNDQSDCELAWMNKDCAVRCLSHRWQGMIKASERGIPRQHPTQKPVALMRWCIQQIKQPGLICDPYTGSGSTLVAAKQLGLKAIGIEIVEDYCRVAADRVSNASVMFPVMTMALPELEQLELLSLQDEG